MSCWCSSNRMYRRAVYGATRTCQWSEPLLRSLVSVACCMAKSKFEYVRKFEQNDVCLLNTWIVVRLDGKCFHRFSDSHGFHKPNDDRCLSLMTHSAKCVMREFSDIVLAYGQSDEYSFVLRRDTTLYSRRASKLISTMSSHFASSFVFHWSHFFPSTELLYPPTFDGRVVLYPTTANLRDYLSWRQADCHINNLYNTCFWALVHDGVSNSEAVQLLKGTVSSDKNELLFSRFKINYNNLPEIYRKGTTLLWSSITNDGNHDDGHHSNSSHGDGINTVDSGSAGTNSVVADTQAGDKIFQTEIATKLTAEHCSDGQVSSGLDDLVLSSTSGKGSGIAASETKLRTTQTNFGSELLSSKVTSVEGRTTAEDDGKRRRGGLSDSRKVQRTILELHVDIIGDSFWKDYPHIIGRTD